MGAMGGVVVLCSLVIFSLSSLGHGLSLNYYDKTCPQAEAIITNVVNKAVMADKKVPAALLRMHFHDCFIRAGGPYWQVSKGRLDGRISRASETRQLPSPAFNFSQLLQSFSQRGLSGADLVALTGGHTLGFSHCSSFQSRIHNFDAAHDVDPTLNPSFAGSLKNICPAVNAAKNAGSNMDTSPATFDNT